MTTPAKRKPAPAKSNVVKLPRPKKPRLTPKASEAEPVPANRPVTDKAAAYRVDTELAYRTATDEIARLDSIDAANEAAHQAALTALDRAKDEAIKKAEQEHANKVAVAIGARDAEREGIAILRGENIEIAARARAALTVDEARIAAFTEGLTGGADQ